MNSDKNSDKTQVDNCASEALTDSEDFIDAEFRRQVISLSSKSLGCIILAGLFIRGLNMDMKIQVVVVSLAVILTLFAIPFLIKRKISIPTAGLTMMFCLSAVGIAAGQANGGLKAPAGVIFLFIPLIGFFCYGKFLAKVGLVISFVGLASLVFLEKMDLVSPLSEVATNPAVRATITFLGCLIGYFIGLNYEKSRSSSNERLQIARKAAIAASEAKSRFLANMSHEIRTPLSGVLGMTNLLLSEVKDPRVLEKLKIIQASGMGLMTVIDKVLDFSKLEAEKVDLELSPCSLPEILRETIILFEAGAFAKNLRISCRVQPDDSPQLMADSGRIRQVLSNLISNAIKFTHQGEIEVTSEVSRLDDNQLIVTVGVHDTGIGIPTNVREKLFQSFSQVDASTTRKYGGTGLGLAICKGLCERMGGSITVESTEGKGSTFRFSFTAKVGSQTSAPQTQSEAQPPAVDYELAIRNPLRILVAEDNLINQKILSEMLAKLGYQADIVGDGHAVLHNLNRFEYDVLFMDCHMPKMDGFTAARELVKKYPKHKRPLIVAATANSLPEDRKICIDSGMDEFLSKPFSFKNLCDILGKAKRRDHSPAIKAS